MQKIADIGHDLPATSLIVNENNGVILYLWIWIRHLTCTGNSRISEGEAL